jgi:hypothetical protein
MAGTSSSHSPELSPHVSIANASQLAAPIAPESQGSPRRAALTHTPRAASSLARTQRTPAAQ